MSRRVESALVAAAVILVYGLTQSGNHSETEDSVSFAVRVRDEPRSELLEGAHLVYLPIGRGFAHVVSALGLTDDPLLALQALDTVLGAVAVAGLWLLLRHAGCTRLAALAASGLAAFSYALWHNAVEPEVYALSAVALVGALAAAWRAATTPGTRAFAVVGVANGAAVLAHVVNVLFAAAVAAALFVAARGAGASISRASRWVAVYVGAASSLVVPGYALAAVVHKLGSPREFWDWFTERTGQAPNLGALDASNLAEALVGSARALLGGHFALSLEPIREFLARRFTGKTFSEELFFLEGFSQAAAIVLLVLAFAAAGLVAVLAAQWLRRPQLDESKRALAVIAAAWLAAYALLFLWWQPLNIELWSVVWLPAAVLIAIPIDAVRHNRAVALVGGTIAAIFVVNLLGSVVPQRDEERDFWRAKAAWYRQHADKDDLVVSNGYIWSSYLRYLLNAQVVDIEDLFREAETDRQALLELRRRLASARGRVLLSGEAFHAFPERRIACMDAPRTCEIAAATARELRDECKLLAAVTDPIERIWRCGADE